MAALSKNTTINHTLLGQDSVIDRDVAAGQEIFQGAGLSYDAGGDVQPLNAADTFAGVAQAYVDNSGGGDGDASVRVIRRAILHDLAVTNLDGKDHIGDTVYMSTSGDYTLVSTSNTAVGKVENYLGTSGRGAVRIEAPEVASV